MQKLNNSATKIETEHNAHKAQQSTKQKHNVMQITKHNKAEDQNSKQNTKHN